MPNSPLFSAARYVYDKLFFIYLKEVYECPVFSDFWHLNGPYFLTYSKTYVKQQLLKRPKIGFQDQLSLNVGQKHCIMLQEEHSAILLTSIKQPFVIKIFVLSIFARGFCTGFTV